MSLPLAGILSILTLFGFSVLTLLIKLSLPLGPSNAKWRECKFGWRPELFPLALESKSSWLLPWKLLLERCEPLGEIRSRMGALSMKAREAKDGRMARKAETWPCSPHLWSMTHWRKDKQETHPWSRTVVHTSCFTWGSLLIFMFLECINDLALEEKKDKNREPCFQGLYKTLLLTNIYMNKAQINIIEFKHLQQQGLGYVQRRHHPRPAGPANSGSQQNMNLSCCQSKWSL